MCLPAVRLPFRVTFPSPPNGGAATSGEPGTAAGACAVRRLPGAPKPLIFAGGEGAQRRTLRTFPDP